MPPPYRGSCLCNAVRFEADRFAPQNAHCHCSMCRKFHGAAFATLAEVADDDFRWIAGEDLLRAYTADNGTTRQFCSICGSSLTFADAGEDPGIVEISLACFDDEVPVVPDAHIYVDYGVGWVEPGDGLPQYGDGRDSKRIK